MKLIYTSIFILLFAFCVSAQNQCATVEECNANLSDASRMINKLLDVNKAQEQAITALKEENAARQRKEAIDSGIIKAQSDLIVLLEKKSRRQVSFLFGLLKIRY